MPSGFPESEFRAFGLAAHAFFPQLLSDEDLNDPLERLWQFDCIRSANTMVDGPGVRRVGYSADLAT